VSALNWSQAMKTVFTMDDIPVEARFAYFRDVVESFYIPIGVKRDEPGDFNAWVNGNDLGNVSIGTCFLGKQAVSRKLEHIRRSEDDRVKLLMPISGSIASRQDTNEATIGPGSFYITDPTRAYEELIIEDMTFIYMLLPRESIVSEVKSIEKITATPFKRNSAFSRLASDFVHSLCSVRDTIDDNAATHVTSIALDLLNTAFREHVEATPTHRTVHRSTLFAWSKAFIDEHLLDSDLSLSKVALAIGISKSYLGDLLAEGGITFQSYVLRQRLERSAKALVDHRFAHLTIEHVAYDSGFSSSAYFSRAFKEMYGISPRDYRAYGVFRDYGASR
jgi:AraC-like DNA-binding protein